MGIKGIYKEIEPERRVSLTRLAVENIEKTGRMLRVAVDVSIWQFQIQSGKGGSNPALRTLYYRLLRLLSTSIRPLFVFDGSQKPPFKRNKRSVASGISSTDFNTKKLLDLFGFPFHVAPGEAEAECALLQREGIVDAVISEDVDTLMFGCGRTFRNWSSEGTRGNHAPTHVSVYDAEVTREGKSGLDRDGMILVALMSGGDYITEGIPGCGIKLACEAARAGYGKSLCRLSRSDNPGIEKWREELSHELQTNEKRHFKTKHKALRIPNTFPNKEVLGYYTHPVVSSIDKLRKLNDHIKWDKNPDLSGLRLFVAKAFDWTGKSGARKFIRGLAPAILVTKLQARAHQQVSDSNDPAYITARESELVKSICGRRQHVSAGGITELRLAFCPTDVVQLDLNAEIDDNTEYDRNGLAPLREDGSFQPYQSDDGEDGGSRHLSQTQKKSTPDYDPMELDKTWVAETVVKISIPLSVEDYEESQRRPKVGPKTKATSKRSTAQSGMPKGAIERYITINKHAKDFQQIQDFTDMSKFPSKDLIDPQGFLTPILNQFLPLPMMAVSASFAGGALSSPSTPSQPPIHPRKDSKSKKSVRINSMGTGNPWNVAQTSPVLDQDVRGARVHISKPGIRYNENSSSQRLSKSQRGNTGANQYCSDSPKSPQILRKKHSRSITPPFPATPPPFPGCPKVSQAALNYEIRPLKLHSGPSQDERISSNSETKSSRIRVLQPLHSTFVVADLPNGIHNPPTTYDNIYTDSFQDPGAELPSLGSLLSKPSNANQIPPVPTAKGIGYIRAEKEIVKISSFPNGKPIPSLNQEIGTPNLPDCGGVLDAKQVGKENRKLFVMPRKSLDGTWREVSEEERSPDPEKGRMRALRLSAIEVVDMTDD